MKIYEASLASHSCTVITFISIVQHYCPSPHIRCTISYSFITTAVITALKAMV